MLIDIGDVTLGYTTRQRWNPPAQWVYSDQPAQDPIISGEIFEQAQQLLHAPRAAQRPRQPRPTSRPYLLQGLLRCGLCGQRMHGTWNNSQAYYRCRGRPEAA